MSAQLFAGKTLKGTTVMRIVIVEDGPACLKGMKKVLEGAGQEVLAILVTSNDRGKKKAVCKKIKDFKPDFVLLDHHLGAGFDGGDVALGCKMPYEKFVGISSSVQSYCGKTFWSNKDDLASESCERYKDASKALLHLLGIQ